MRRTITSVLTASVIAVAWSGSVQAQTRIAAPRYPFEDVRDSLLKGVALTDSQKIKVEAIARGYWELMHANDARMKDAPRDTQRSFLRELRDKQVNDLRRVLNPVQQKKFDENRAMPKTPARD